MSTISERDKLLSTIFVLWNKYPEQRLMQLLMNAIRSNTHATEAHHYFYIEDEELRHCLAMSLKKQHEKQTTSEM